MHPTLLVVKRSQAIERIERAARLLAERAQIDPSRVDALTSVGNHPQVRELRKLECIADVLDMALAEAGVTAVTETPVPAQNVQTDAQNEEAVLANTFPPAGMIFTESSTEAVVPAAELPLPSLSDDPAAKPKTKRSRK